MFTPLSPEKRLEWKERILAQQASGLSATKWCHQNQVSLSSFFYWKDRFFPKQKLFRSSFTELSHINGSGISLEYHGVRISLERDFDPLILKRCLFTLMELRC